MYIVFWTLSCFLLAKFSSIHTTHMFCLHMHYTKLGWIPRVWNVLTPLTELIKNLLIVKFLFSSEYPLKIQISPKFFYHILFCTFLLPILWDLLQNLLKSTYKGDLPPKSLFSGKYLQTKGISKSHYVI